MGTRAFLLLMAAMLPASLLAGAGGALLVLRLDAAAGQPAPRLVTADLTGMTRAFTLRLAGRGLDAPATEAAAEAWADGLAARLETTARRNRLVIIPKGVGVFGAPDITDRLIPLLPRNVGPEDAAVGETGAGETGTGETGAGNAGSGETPP